MAPRAASALSAAAALALLLSLAAPVPSHGFWFSTSARSKSQAPQWFGIRDYGAASQAAYSYDTSGGVTVAVPVAVPLSPHQVQVSPPYPGLGAVQLVPCLCPISKDPESLQPLGQSYAPHPQQMATLQHPQMVPMPPQLQMHPMPPPLHPQQQQVQAAATQSAPPQQQQQQQQPPSH